MAIRTTDDDSSHLRRLRDRIRTTLFSSGDRSTTDEDDEAAPSRPNPDAPGNLFQCSTCGTVYIDAQKSHCSTCDEDVEEVRSTLESALARR